MYYLSFVYWPLTFFKKYKLLPENENRKVLKLSYNVIVKELEHLVTGMKQI